MSFCRWGILSTAEIGQKNWQAIQLSGSGVVKAVASRDQARAQAFIDLCQSQAPFDECPEAVGSYEALIARDDIDAVYIPLPTGMRKHWVLEAARAGKHVLCEKPCAVSAEELQEMISACESAGVQFMDGIMYMHGNRLPVVREALDAPGNVGDIRRVYCQFSFCADDEWLATNIRLNSDLEPQGCLGDLGWYCIRFALWSLGFRLPNSVTARIHTDRKRDDSPAAVPLEFSAEMIFDDGVSAGFYCSFITHHQQWANISGDKGYLHINDFVLPYRGTETRFEISNADFVVDKCDFHMLDHRRSVTVEEAGNGTTNSMETNLFRNFSDIVNRGELQPQWHDYAMKTQILLDACLAAGREGRAVEVARHVSV